MNRFVLALLALLAGLVTQTAPAHARLAAGSGSQITAPASEAGQRAVAARREAVRTPAEAPRTKLLLEIKFERQVVVLPDFYSGIDRAHE